MALDELAQCWLCIQLIFGGQTLDVIESGTDNTVLAGVELNLVFYQSLHLFVPVCDHFPTGASEGYSFTLVGTKDFLDVTYGNNTLI